MWKISIKKPKVRRSGVFSMLPAPENKVFYLFNALILALLCNSYAYAETQFFDDFNGGAVDESIWTYPTGDVAFQGRTHMRAGYPSVSNGLLHLQLDTFNPTAHPVGDFFYGSEILSRKNFERGTGLIMEIRARMVSPVKGLVGGAFFYKYFPATQLHSEIDFELLTNRLNQVQTNIYSNEPLGIGHSEYNSTPQYDMTQFNIYRIEWLPDRVRWFVNNQLLREDATIVPKEALNLHLNLYATECHWAAACDPYLLPASSTAKNKTSFFDIDWVRIISDVSPQSTAKKKNSSSPRKR